MPNIVRKLRSLCAIRFDHVCVSSSRIGRWLVVGGWWLVVSGKQNQPPTTNHRLLKNDLLFLAQPIEHLGPRAVADADLDRLAFAALGLTRRRNFDRGVALLVVNHGA